MAVLPGAPPLPSQYLQPERQFWRRLAASPPPAHAAPGPAAATAGQPATEGLWSARNEPLVAAAQGTCSADWKPPVQTALSAMGAAWSAPAGGTQFIVSH